MERTRGVLKMNEKDYKAIAEIIKKYRGVLRDRLNDYEMMNLDLADYFEKEMQEERYDWANKIPRTPIEKVIKKFNKEQFLRDCGLKE